jgi:uncharacterized protein YcfJ
MKQTLMFAALGLTALGATAQEVGNVISSVPVVQQIAVPRQVCHNQPMVVEQQPSGAGGLLGAIAGAAIGSQIGGGSGRGVAMVAGTVGGALLGNNMERGGQYVQNVPQCGTQTSYENRTVAYNVTYEYAGRQYTVQMPYDPGPTIQLQVTPIGASDPNQAPPTMAQGPVVMAPPVVVAPAPPVVYPAYGGYPAYPAYPVYGPAYRPIPIGISLGFGFGGHRHGHRHWR